MKRSDALAPLSRDHHQGLFAALKLRRATEADAAEAREAFLSFWTSDGAHHFHVEEDILLPAFARHVGPDHQEIVRTLVEHVDLRRRAADVANDAQPPLEELHELGERLSEHIRHEENVLFGLIESALPEPELVALGEAVEAA